MKTFGIISKMDENGGVKLPDVLLGLCEVGIGDNLEMHLAGDNLVMRKYPPACIFCGATEDLQEYKGKNYCSCCAGELKNY